MTTTNTYGRQVVVPLANKSGGSVAAGDVVIVDTANNDAFTTTTTGAFTSSIGVAQETIANNATGRVLLSGYAALVNVNASVTRGNFGKTHTVAKQATDAGASRIAGTFCLFLTGGTTPDAVVWQPDIGAGSGLTDPMTTRGDIIVRNSSNVTARLGIGSSGKVLQSDGTDISWQTPSSGLTLITDLLLGSDTASFDFTSIPGTYKHLRIEISARCTAAGGDIWLALQFNGDTGSNYDCLQIQSFVGGTSAAWNEDLGTTSAVHAVNAAGSSAPSGSVGAATLSVPDYAGTTFHKGFHVEGYGRVSTGSGNIRVHQSGGTWRSTSAITRVTLTPSSGNIATGSRASLYGLG